MPEQEQWRQIPGFSAYRVSDQGRVVSYKGREPRILRQVLGANGYFAVSLHGNGRHTRTVHSLVAEAFHGPRPDTGHEVRHLNGQRQDCRAINLRWGTRLENVQDTTRHGRNYWANRTHCKQGHPWSEANTRRNAKQRICKTCRRDVLDRYAARQADKALRAAGIAA